MEPVKPNLDRKKEIMTKKILFFIAVFLFLTATYQNVSAKEQFHEGGYIPNIYIKKEKEGRIRYQQARFLLRKSDQHFAYCLEPWEVVNEKLIYEQAIDVNQLSDDTLQKIALTAYYGYGYKNHTDQKWYYITQIVIWRLADPSAQFYFTDHLNGNKTNRYDNDIDELITLVNRHFLTPDFHTNEITLTLNEKRTLYDFNNVLSLYHIDESSNIPVEKSNSLLTVKGLTPGEFVISLTKKDQLYQIPPIIYPHDNSQDLLVVGSFQPIQYQIPVHVKTGNITVHKIDSDNKENTPQGDAVLDGAVFQLTSDDGFYQEAIIQNGIATFSNLSYGTYTLTEKKPGTGYQQNLELTIITINGEKNEHTVTIANEVIEGKITIEKWQGKKEDNRKEAGITFAIYNMEDIQVGTMITDQNGIAEITLPYGTYLIKQLTTKENYQLMDDFIVDVTENKNYYYEIENLEITQNIRIEKRDDETDNLILAPTYFKIWNIDKQEFLHRQENGISYDYFETINGILEIKNLPLGNYQLVEIKAPTGYKRSEEKITFQLDKTTDTKTIICYNTPERTIPVPNTRTYQIELEKEEINWYDKKKYPFIML